MQNNIQIVFLFLNKSKFTFSLYIAFLEVNLTKYIFQYN